MNKNLWIRIENWMLAVGIAMILLGSGYWIARFTE